MDFLSNVLGNDGVAKIVGEKVGDVAEDCVNKVLGSGDKGKAEDEGEKEKEKEGGFSAADCLSLVTGDKKDDDKGGFDVGDALSLFKK